MIKKLKTNQSGVAIILVMTSVTILTIILATFSYVISINKLRVYNFQDYRQARLNAEAGLSMALAQLELYQEAFNLYQKNKSIQDLVSFNEIESALTQPFIIPIPIDKNKLNLIQKTALEDFEEASVIKGGLMMSISPIKSFLNPNGLINLKGSKNQGQPTSAENSSTPINQLVKEELTRLLTNLIERKNEESDSFSSKYANIRPEVLISELEHYVNNSENFDSPDKADFEILYDQNEPKFAPLASKEEIYNLEGWPEDIIEMIYEKISPHNVMMIPLNKINKEHLRIIFPDLTDEQANDFFIQRDGDPLQELPPTPIKNLDDFKRMIKLVSSISESEINNRVTDLKKIGLELSVASKIFKVEVTGSYKQATLKMSAIVDLPILPQPVSQGTKTKTEQDDQEVSEDQGDNEGKKVTKNNKSTPSQLMAPRVIELLYQ